ncbi:MAG: PorV/PorQ family protein, partial [Bacteroidota bacterium]
MRIIATIIILSTSLRLTADAPKYSNEFLSIGVGARPMALSGAVVASSDDATSALWNPAGLSRCKGDLQLAAMHAELFAGISKFDYATLATRIDSSRTIGFSIVRFGTDDIPNTLDLIDASGLIDYSRLSSFSIADYAFVFSYSQTTRFPGLRIGGNAKVIHRKAGDFGKAWGFGFDLGAQYTVNRWQFGVMAKDITSTFNAWSYNTELLEGTFSKTGNEIPKNSTEITLPKLIPGAAYRFDFSDKFSLTGEINAELTFDGQRNTVISSDVVNVDPRAGIEVGYADLVFLRGGIQNIQKVKDFDGGTSTIMQPNLGIGIRLGRLSVDYALTNIGSQQVLYSNVFSLRL